MIQFIYDSLSPAPFCKPQKNKVTVWIEDGKIHYKRQYINTKGKVSNGIEHSFEENTTPLEVAKLIHWGCSGTSFNAYQLQPLIEKIQPLFEEVA